MSFLASRSLPVLAFVGAFGLVGAAAQAQTFTFGDAEEIQVAPGETLSVPVFLSGVTPGVAGVNFTVRVTNPGLFNMAGGDTVGAAAVSGFTIVDNPNLPRTDLTGSPTEFRAVIYSANSTPQTFNANTRVQIATLTIPVQSSAPDGSESVFTLVSAIENQIGLLGVSDANGNSIVPTGQTRPAGDTITIKIEGEGGNNPQPLDLDEWTYAAFLPGGNANPDGSRVLPQGALRIATEADNSFGFWQDQNTVAPTSAYIVDFNITGSSEPANGVPPRLRTFPSDSSYALSTLYTGSLVKPGNTAKNYSIVVPAGVVSGTTPAQIGLAMDVLLFGTGTPGNSITLNSVQSLQYAPGAATELYNPNFTAGNAQNWTFAAPVVNTGGLGSIRGANGAANANGLGITTIGLPTNAGISFGFWQSPEAGFANASSDVVYRVTAEVVGDAGVDSLGHQPTFRIRLFPANNQFGADLEVNPSAGGTSPIAPSGSGTSYDAWFITPSEVNGQPLRLAFDMYDTRTQDAVSPDTQNPTLSLRNLTVRSYPRS